MTPCLGLPEKLSFYQSAVMPSRQTLSAQRLTGLSLPIVSPVLPFFFSLALPALCQQNASIPPCLLSHCILSACLSLCLTSSLHCLHYKINSSSHHIQVHKVCNSTSRFQTLIFLTLTLKQNSTNSPYI